MKDHAEAENCEKWQGLAMLVAAGRTIKAGAEELSISERQAYRYSSLPEFRKAVSQYRSAALDSAVGALNELTGKAVEKLESLLNTDDALGAAKTILASVTRLSELGELRQRIEALESKGGSGH